MSDIYRVITMGDCEARTEQTVAYAQGKPEDIEAFYDDQKIYRLRLEKIEIRTITTEESGRKQALLASKAELERAMKVVKDQLAEIRQGERVE